MKNILSNDSRSLNVRKREQNGFKMSYYMAGILGMWMNKLERFRDEVSEINIANTLDSQ